MSISRPLALLIVAAVLFGCAYFAGFLKSAATARLSADVHIARPQFGTYPPDCEHLNEHKEWALCMGVGYVTN